MNGGEYGDGQSGGSGSRGHHMGGTTDCDTLLVSWLTYNLGNVTDSPYLSALM